MVIFKQLTHSGLLFLGGSSIVIANTILLLLSWLALLRGGRCLRLWGGRAENRLIARFFLLFVCQGLIDKSKDK
jgi:hypothetical protein